VATDEQWDRLLGPRILEGAQQALDESRTLSLAGVADSVGLSEARLGRLFEAAGRFRETGYGDRDLAYARTMRELLTVVGEDELVRAARVRRRAISTIVVNDLMTVSRLLRQVEEQAADASIEELSDLLTAAGTHLAPLIEGLLPADYRETLLRLLDTEVVGDSSRSAATGQVDLAVGFADVVGFTRLSATTDPDALTQVLKAFESRVHDAVDGHGGILVSKFIGDAAMLVSGDADLLASALLDVVEADEGELEGVPRRAGLAYGSVLVREGDYFGTAVNLAARLTDLARPGTVLVEPDTRERLSEEWDTHRTRPMKVKGLGTMQPYRLRRPAKATSDDG
jgi:adenylate cyclase